MENETVVEEKTLTREQKLEELQAIHAQHKARIEQFSFKLPLLRAAKDHHKKLEADKVADELENTDLGMSPKGVEDKLFTLPHSSTMQLDNNILRMEDAIAHETNQARKIKDQIRVIEKEKFDEISDANSQEVYRLYFEWIDYYRKTRDFYWNVLVPAIQKSWDHDRDFPERGRKFGVNANAIVSIISHFRHGEFADMESTIDKILYMADIEKTGKPLLEKQGNAEWPENAFSTFFKESEFKKNK